MIDIKFSNARPLLPADELAGMNASQSSSDGTRLLTSDELAGVSGGVVICYGPSPRPYPASRDGAPPVPPGGSNP